MNGTADKIASAIATESVPDPKIVRVMIKDAVDLKFKEAETAKKKQAKSSKQPQQQQTLHPQKMHEGPNRRGTPR